MLGLRLSSFIVAVAVGGWWWLEQPSAALPSLNQTALASREMEVAITRIAQASKTASVPKDASGSRAPASMPSPASAAEANAESRELTDIVLENGTRKIAHVRALLDKLSPDEFPLRFSLIMLLSSPNEPDPGVSVSPEETAEEREALKALLLEQLSPGYWESAPESLQSGYRSALMGAYRHLDPVQIAQGQPDPAVSPMSSVLEYTAPQPGESTPSQ